MAKICVYLHGQLLSELALMPGQEYFAGRASQSDIHLSSERGISRQHVKFFEQDGVWHAHLLSKYGGMIFEEQSVEVLELRGTTRFSVPPYDFVFESQTEMVDATKPIHNIEGGSAPEESPEPADQSTHDKPSDSTFEPQVDSTPEPQSESAPESNGDQNDNEPSFSDRTVLAQPARLIPYLKVVNNKLKTEEVLKLEGTSWRVGRNPENEIVVNDSAISRNHLEISKRDEKYFVTDLGSSNGTQLNGLKIEPNAPQSLQSGDVLTVRHLEIILELHDSAYENQNAPLPVKFDDNSAAFETFDLVREENALENVNRESGTGIVVKMDSSWRAKWLAPEMIKKRVVPVGIAVLILSFVYVMSRSSTQPKSLKGQANSASTGGLSLGELTPEQKKQVIDFFNLAHNYYTERKYTLCLSQLQLMTQLTPFYLNSKELENLCQQGQIDEARALDREREKKEQQKTDEEVQANIAKCQKQLNASTTVSSMRSCLDEAIQLDPANPAVMNLLSQASIRQSQAQSQAQQAEEFRRRKREGQAIFSAAEDAYRNRNNRQALYEYRRFLSGGYPGLNQDDDVASRHLASIESGIEHEFTADLNECQGDISNNDLKNAIKACSDALNVRPGDPAAEDMKKRAYSRLSDEMRAIYQDSELEENMGNIDSAKDKWLKIIRESVPGEDYYEKAKNKLITYGVAM